ncbi:MAG TPA: hypothetical protein VMV07_08545 [Streptosporangiaceae bacterium]|nr:hypothetical protein [Streptosporangiaceae bacterium]
MQLLRRNSAREYAKSVKEVGEDLTVAGKETVAGIEAECRDLGLAAFTQQGNELEGQTRPGYTARVKALTDELGYQGGYSIYSSAAHAELAGVWRLFGETGATFPARKPIYGPTANPKASFAAADGALKSMMGPMERIASLFGWTVPGRGDEISATIDYMNGEMKRLRPQALRLAICTHADLGSAHRGGSSPRSPEGSGRRSGPSPSSRRRHWRSALSGENSVRLRCAPWLKLRHSPGDAEDALSAFGYRHPVAPEPAPGSSAGRLLSAQSLRAHVRLAGLRLPGVNRR